MSQMGVIHVGLMRPTSSRHIRCASDSDRSAGFTPRHRSGRDVRFIARPPPRSVRAAFPSFIRSTIRLSPWQHAGASASTGRKSISAPSSPVRRWELNRWAKNLARYLHGLRSRVLRPRDL